MRCVANIRVHNEHWTGEQVLCWKALWLIGGTCLFDRMPDLWTLQLKSLLKNYNFVSVNLSINSVFWYKVSIVYLATSRIKKWHPCKILMNITTFYQFHFSKNVVTDCISWRIFRPSRLVSTLIMFIRVFRSYYWARDYATYSASMQRSVEN